MNDESDYTPFVNPSQITDGEEVVFVSEGKLTSDMWADNRLQIDVRFSTGQVQRLTVNKTSQKNLVTAYGPDTAAWVNRKARITATKKPVGGGGKWKYVITLYPIE
jgi:hypothetical protein